MIDALAIKALMGAIDDAVNGIGEICEREDIPNPVENGMKLLLVRLHLFLIKILTMKRHNCHGISISAHRRLFFTLSFKKEKRQ